MNYICKLKTDSINFTDDLIKGFCEESGINLVMMRRMYEFYTIELTKKISTREEVIEAPIKNLGIFFMPLHGAIITSKKKEGFIETYGEHNRATAEFYEKKKEFVKKKIQKCKDCGVKNIKFLYTLISKKYVKNG